MKTTFLKISLVVAFIFIISENTFAQKSTSEITLKYGTSTSQEFSSHFENFMESAFGVKNGELKSLGAITGGYEYYISDRVSLGVSLTYQNFKNTVKTQNESNRVNSDWFIPMANAKYLYLNNDKFQLYGKAGLGYALVNTTVGTQKGKKQNEFAYQITAIGLRYGNKLGIVLDAGYGYQGSIISGGLSIKF